MKEAQAKNTHCSVFNIFLKLQIRRMSAEICRQYVATAPTWLPNSDGTFETKQG